MGGPDRLEAFSVIGRSVGGGLFTVVSPGGDFAVIAMPDGGDLELDAPALDVDDLSEAAIAAA